LSKVPPVMMIRIVTIRENRPVAVFFQAVDSARMAYQYDARCCVPNRSNTPKLCATLVAEGF
jgi:hypothetical protein